jgi:CO/xanthine dehydrogenase Mo-binding subunit
VNKLTLTADVGIVLNPDGTMAQLRGGLLWGLALATRDSSNVLNGAIAQNSLMRFNPLRMKDVPELEVHLVESHHYPVGAGEPATTVVAPAIANAIARAVGSRVRDLPITADKIKNAMKS